MASVQVPATTPTANTDQSSASLAAVVCTNVGMVYGKGPASVHALRGVNLSVAPGEFIVVLGPSGSGKTTLLNVIGAIEQATSGQIEVAGVDIAALDRDGRSNFRRTRIGFVFQFFNLVPTLTASENVQLIAELAGPDAEARTSRVLAQVGISDAANRFPAELSGGEQQRVAIARAMVKEPPLLLCDEPTGSLDLATGRQVLAHLYALAREGHHSVILVTHNSAIARMADRVIRMRSGEVAEDRVVEQPIPPEQLEW
jgi:putative ABC transport system ATP-binding protein